MAVSKYQYLFFFRFRLENYKFYFMYNRESIPVPILTKKEKMLVKLFLHFIPMDSDPDLHLECGSGSTDLHECGYDRIRNHITDYIIYTLKQFFLRMPLRRESLTRILKPEFSQESKYNPVTNRNRVFRGQLTSSIISTNQGLASQNTFITLLYTTILT